MFSISLLFVSIQKQNMLNPDKKPLVFASRMFLDSIPYSYKFSRDVYFADATNSAFLRFYFRGLQDFVSIDYVRTIIKHKIFEDLIFVDHTLSTKTAKFTSLENLYEYGMAIM